LDTKDYTPKYSAVIKLARLIIVQEAYEQRRETIIHYKSHRINTKKTRDKTDSYYVLTRRLVYAFMTIAYDNKDPKPI
jgi:hypothetical protein